MMSRTTGTATATLSNPVSESAAIAWAESEYPGWSDWFGVVPTDRTWSSFWQAYVPGQGGQYSYLKVNFRRIKGGFTPGNEYVCVQWTCTEQVLSIHLHGLCLQLLRKP